MMDHLFLQISALLGMTVTLALLTRLLRQPLVVAYLVSGIIAGPLVLNVLHEEQAFLDTLAQFGIVLLLFLVGLSLNISYVRRVGSVVFVAAVSQCALSTLLAFFLMVVLGLSLFSALFLAVATAFSSTIIVVKLLGDKKDLEALYGRFTIGTLLVQDIIAIALMIFLNSTTEPSPSWVVTFGVVAFKGIIIAAFVYLLSRYILPVVMDRVALSGELLFIFALAWCFGIASLAHTIGFTLEIGAILAGVALGASPYQSLISSRLRPLRDFFIVVFFIVLGSNMQLGAMRAAATPAVFLTLFVLIIDPLILYGIMRLCRYTRRNAFLASMTAAQVSEFGFILLYKAEALGYIDPTTMAMFTLVALGTITISSYLIIYNEDIYRFFRPWFEHFGKDRARETITALPPPRVWVFGYHRIGWKVCAALQEKGESFAVVDFDPAVVQKLHAEHVPAYFGDAADVEFLESLPLHKATMIISTLPEVDDQKTLITHVRQAGGRGVIIANLYDSAHLDDLYAAGADYVMMPHLLGGAWMADVLLEHLWTRKAFQSLRRDQKREMELRDMPVPDGTNGTIVDSGRSR